VQLVFPFAVMQLDYLVDVEGLVPSLAGPILRQIGIRDVEPGTEDTEMERKWKKTRIAFEIVWVIAVVGLIYWDENVSILDLPDYYSNNPSMIPVVLGIACLGGLMAWLAHKYPRLPRRIELWMWAICGTRCAILSGQFFMFSVSSVGSRTM